jgi:O-antigen/teichoic acid export membrane protein
MNAVSTHAVAADERAAAVRRPKNDSSFRPALILMAGRALASVFTFMIPVILTRQLDPALVGAYKQLFLIYATLYAIGQIGMAESLYYFIPHYPEQGGRLVTNAAATLGLCGLTSLVLLTLARGSIAGLVGNPDLAPYLPLLGIFLATMLVTTVLEIAMISRQRYLWASATYVATDVARTVLLVGPVLLGAGVRGLLLGACASAGLRLVATIFYVRREYPAGLGFDRRLLRVQLAYTLPFALAVAVEIAQSTLHQYVVSYRFDAATFALYSIGCLQIPLIDFMAGPACNVMMVRMAEARRRGDTASVLASFEDTTRKLALFFFPLLGVLLVCGRDVILLLFTDRYAASVPIFRLWCLVVLLAVFQTDGLMRVLAETRFLFVVNVTRLVLIAVLMSPLLTIFGLRGPVVVTLLGMVVAKTMMLARWKRRYQVSLPELLPWGGLLRVALAATGAAAAALTLSATLAAPLVVRLAAVGTVYGAAYLCLLLLTGSLTAEERQALSFRRSRTLSQEAA